MVSNMTLADELRQITNDNAKRIAAVRATETQDAIDCIVSAMKHHAEYGINSGNFFVSDFGTFTNWAAVKRYFVQNGLYAERHINDGILTVSWQENTQP